MTPGGLESLRIEVDGRGASYSVGGDGSPVVFLHGWGLAENAYRRALERLVHQGCRVYAPALPGFGGTAALPGAERSMEGYAAWVHAFMDAVGVPGAALVVGHSFGGGVAIQLAHDFPASVRYLVLLNSVGGAEWAPGLLSAARRPGWMWGLQFMRDLTPVGEGIQVMRAMAEDFVPNLVRNPRTLLEAGALARRADLSTELAELGRRELPVLVLWGDHDRVLPVGLFDSVCRAIGTEGRIVPGSHSWLLADPDTFGEVMTNVVEVAARADGLVEFGVLLQTTSMPSETVASLVDHATGLWLASEPASVLAGDLVLCHPPLQPDEVRAVSRPLGKPGAFRLTVVAHDRPRLLADTAAVLAAAGLSVTRASATTWLASGVALHALTVEAPDDFAADRWDDLGAQLRSIAAGDTPDFTFTATGRATVRCTPQDTSRSHVSVTAPDRIGLLWAICDWLGSRGVSIEAARITSRSGVARDDFIVSGQFDPASLAARLTASGEPMWRSIPCPMTGMLRRLARVQPTR